MSTFLGLRSFLACGSSSERVSTRLVPHSEVRFSYLQNEWTSVTYSSRIEHLFPSHSLLFVL